MKVEGGFAGGFCNSGSGSRGESDLKQLGIPKEDRRSKEEEREEYIRF